MTRFLVVLVGLCVTNLAEAAPKGGKRAVRERVSGGQKARGSIREGGKDQDAEGTALETNQRALRLADRIPSVTGRVFRKAGRLELAPGIGLSMNDPFYRHILVQGDVAYHLDESWAVGMHARYSVAIDRSPDVSGAGVPPDTTYNRPVYGAFVTGQWAPLYGKINLAAESVLHFDLFATVGAGVLQRKAGRMTVAGLIGLGHHLSLTEWLALRLDVRTLLFQMIRTPEVNGRETFMAQFDVALGVSFFPFGAH